MVDFKFYLNKQGPKGAQGDKGDQGFSPVISVDTNTAAEYKLLITNETSSFTTDNLRGTAVDDQGGTYMRYNTTTQSMYAGNPNYASSSQYGEVMIASDDDITAAASDKVVTAEQLVDYVTTATGEIEIGDGVLTIQQDGTTLATFNANTSTNTTVNIKSPVVGNGILTVAQGGTTLGTFTANATTNQTINIPVPPTINVDSTLSTTSTSPVQNKTITVELNKKVDSTSLSTVATSGNYNDLTGKPTIPTVNNSTITFNYGTTEISSITLNQAAAETITIPTTGETVITTTIDSSSTNSEAAGAKAVYDALQDVTVGVATTTSTGVVQPDGTTILIDENGVISSVGGGGGAGINDSSASTTETYSSMKIEELVQASGLATLDTVEDYYVASDTVRNVVSLTQAEYSTITPSNNTEYIITDAPANLNVDVNNISQTGMSTVAYLASPAATGENISIAASGTSYTMNHNGWLNLIGNGSSGTPSHIAATNTTAHIQCVSMIPSNYGNPSILMPVSAGDVVTINYSVSSWNTARFIYVKGSEGEAS